MNATVCATSLEGVVRRYDILSFILREDIRASHGNLSGIKSHAYVDLDAAIGAFMLLIGLGGDEFRLPLLIRAFRFQPLEAIILNKYATRHLNVGKGQLFDC